MQPSKMQALKSLFTPSERRGQSRRQTPSPITVVPPSGRRRGSDVDDLTPMPRSGTQAHLPEAPPAAFYMQRAAARSQPELPSARHLGASLLAGPEPGATTPRGPAPGPLLLGRALPTKARNPSTDRLPILKRQSPRDEPLLGAEGRDAVPGLPIRFGHSRSAGSQDTSGSHAVFADYSSSVTSGYLSRGPSTNSSTARSEGTLDFRRQSLEACCAQQDFFLGGLRLSPSQRGQLLVGLPETVVAQYCRTYDRPWVASFAPDLWPFTLPQGLEEERLLAFARIDVNSTSQRTILRTSQAILRAAAGCQRLCRFMRFVLHSEVEEGQGCHEDELFDVSALTATEARGLLEPLQLTPSQEARLKKHCRHIPQRLESSRGFASPVSYKAPF